MKNRLKKISFLTSIILTLSIPSNLIVVLAENSETKDKVEEVSMMGAENSPIENHAYQISDADYKVISIDKTISIYTELTNEYAVQEVDLLGEVLSVKKEAQSDNGKKLLLFKNAEQIGWVTSNEVEVIEPIEDQIKEDSKDEELKEESTEERVQPLEVEEIQEVEENTEANQPTAAIRTMKETITPKIVYSSYVKTQNWGTDKTGEQISGTVGQKLPVQGIRLNIPNVTGLNIKYSTHVQSYGWTDWVENGAVSGYPTQGKRIEAIKLELSGEQASNYDIYYRVHSQSFGWLGWAKNGEPTGTESLAKQVEAYEVLLVKKGENHPRIDLSKQTFITPETPVEETQVPSVYYSTHVQSKGWLQTVHNPMLSGTVGESKRVEAFRATIQNYDDLSVQYSTKPQGKNWTGWSTNNQISGTTGETRPLEALKITLNGKNSNQFDIYYRVHVQKNGWLDWAKNGASAGTIGHDKQIEAIEIQIVDKGDSFNGEIKEPYLEKITVSYNTSVSGLGWQSPVEDGVPSGTTGQKLSMTGLRLYTPNNGLNIEYSAHVQSHGWMGWVTDNKVGGSSDLSKRLEAVKIRLTGSEASKYDIYYRLHTENFGWLDWAKNGEAAGTEGYGFRAEAMEVKIMPKGSIVTNPNNAIKTFTTPTISYATHIQKDGWLDNVSNGKLSGTTGQSKRVEALRVRLENKPFTGGLVYSSYIRGTGWTSNVAEGLLTGTVGEGKPLEAISINLTGQMAKYYDIYYRVHSQSYGWLGWAKNGMNAGTRGRNKQVEAVEIKLVKKGSGPAVDPNESYIEKLLIFLDPGHGGIPSTGGNPGPVYNGVREQDLNLNIAVQVKERLENLGYQVVMSRENDLNSYFPRWQDDLYARPAHANELKADIFVSIHHNAHPSSRATNGIETYYYGTNPNHPPLPENEDSHDDPHRISESRRLANAIHEELITNTGARDRKVQDGAFAVTREARMPAVLLELGFMSNPTELSKLRTTSYQRKLVNGIVTGIHNYFLI